MCICVRMFFCVPEAEDCDGVVWWLGTELRCDPSYVLYYTRCAFMDVRCVYTVLRVEKIVTSLSLAGSLDRRQSLTGKMGALAAPVPSSLKPRAVPNLS